MSKGTTPESLAAVGLGTSWVATGALARKEHFAQRVAVCGLFWGELASAFGGTVGWFSPESTLPAVDFVSKAVIAIVAGVPAAIAAASD